ncbi:response regulator transcription factor [Sorangium sp. So ce131]|uniref:response regulator transcription factor n=1 Tax=Sorangium sp. So ce131 TaxID=3133282 RepID=UPI003F62E05E
MVDSATFRGAPWGEPLVRWCQQVGFVCEEIDGGIVELLDRSGRGTPRILVADFDALAAASALRVRGGSAEAPLFIIASSAQEAAEALWAGADEVLRGPLDEVELHARLSRICRPRGPSQLSFGPLFIDRSRCEVLARGQRVQLRKAEYSLLVYLIEQHPRAVDPHEIMRVVFQARGDGGTVRYHVCMLRKKLAAVDADVLRNIRGVGYCASCGCASCEPAEGEAEAIGPAA